MSFLPKFLTRRSDRVEPTECRYVDQITLADASEGKYLALTPIPYADALTPTPHSLPRLDPHDADLHQFITDTVHRLALAGALDEFTVDVLDNWIDKCHETWVAPVMKHAEIRRETSARLISVVRESLVRESVELKTITDRRADLITQHNTLSAALGLPRSTSIKEVKELPTLPSEHTSLLYSHFNLPIERARPDAAPTDPTDPTAHDNH